jgi:hypothetical protein
MAQTVKAVKKLLPEKYSIGARFIQLVEVELGTEYKAKGVVVPASELGMPDEIIDFAIPLSEVLLAAEGTEGFGPSLVIEKPGESGSVVKIQVFGSGAAKKEAAFELADKAGSAKEGKILLLVVGR